MSQTEGLTAAQLPTVSFLKWAGGKRRQVPRLRELYEPHRDRRLVELFCGAANVALGLQPRQALLNDANPHLVNCMRWVQNPDGFKASLIDWRNQEEHYYALRARFNYLAAANPDSEEAAQIFYYLNQLGFNGICRFSSGGRFNIPWGKYKRQLGRPPEDGKLQPWKQAMQGFDFICSDFRKVELKADDFVYADPPYDSPVDESAIQGNLLGVAGWDDDGKGFTSYSLDKFRGQDQIDLAELLARHPGPVIIHNRATDRVVRLYESLGFDLEYVMARRSAACNGDRAAVEEVIAKRNL